MLHRERDEVGEMRGRRGVNRTPSYLVGAGPVGDVINDKALHHEVLRSCVVAAAGGADVALLSAPVIVSRHQLVQNRIWAVPSCVHLE